MKKQAISVIIALVVGLGIGGGIGGYTVHANESTANKQTISSETIMAYDWLENSGEAESLQYQAYNTATRNLQEMIKQPSSKPKAVILDIDETCLNNAPGEGYQIANNTKFNVDVWNKWVQSAKATAIPGAAEFTQAAKKAGVQVFYISNRIPDQLQATIKNLDKCGFADANESGHVILDPVKSQAKQSRFDSVEKDYDVVMFFGDQLTDMGQAYENKTSQQEKEQVTQDKNKWGWKYIAIPNPTYGNFENAMFNNKKLTEEQKVEMSKEGIQSFDPKTGEVIKNQKVINE